MAKTTTRRRGPSVYDLVTPAAPGHTQHALSLSTAAARWDCSKDYLLDRIRSGELRAFKAKGPKGEWKVRIEDVDALFPEVA